MRIIFIRHGQSLNNELREQSEELYRLHRAADPVMSAKGERETKEVALAFTKLGIKVDGIYTSALIRAM